MPLLDHVNLLWQVKQIDEPTSRT
jgi:hypothetical protein